MIYKPQPIDTSGVRLPDALDKLVERLSAHKHDIWAGGRIEDGWSYGEQRNDQKKTHPELGPYDDLSESEKDYDRRSVVQILKAIVSLGYRIESPSS